MIIRIEKPPLQHQVLQRQRLQLRREDHTTQIADTILIGIIRIHLLIDRNTIRTINLSIRNTIMVIAYSLNDQTLTIRNVHTNHTLGIHLKIQKLPIIHAIIRIDPDRILRQQHPQRRNDLFDDNRIQISRKHVIPAMMLSLSLGENCSFLKIA